MKKNNALWFVTACSQVEEYPENGGSMSVIPDYKVSHPRRQFFISLP
jgi:hypothetical protein